MPKRMEAALNARSRAPAPPPPPPPPPPPIEGTLPGGPSASSAPYVPPPLRNKVDSSASKEPKGDWTKDGVPALPIPPSPRRQSSMEKMGTMLSAPFRSFSARKSESEAQRTDEEKKVLAEAMKEKKKPISTRPSARMLHPLNGRRDFDLLTTDPMAIKMRTPLAVRLTPALVLAMLRREDELRLSEAVQRAYGGSDCFEIFCEITEGVQRQVVAEFGFEEEEAARAAIESLRTCETLWPERAADFRQSSHYRKYNRARCGELKPNDAVPDVALGSLDGVGDAADSSLSAVLAASAAAAMPTLLVAGSYS